VERGINLQPQERRSCGLSARLSELVTVCYKLRRLEPIIIMIHDAVQVSAAVAFKTVKRNLAAKPDGHTDVIAM
jgi:hypothetical protein